MCRQITSYQNHSAIEVLDRCAGQIKDCRFSHALCATTESFNETSEVSLQVEINHQAGVVNDVKVKIVFKQGSKDSQLNL